MPGRAAKSPIREQKTEATRARIAETALDLFLRQGYTETTIDQIAVAAAVGRRTVFRHFATKEAILFDHLVVRRERTVELLQQRPVDEPVLESLHTVLRELTEEGFDRRHLDQIRAVLATNPELVGEELTIGIRAYEKNVISTLERRAGQQVSHVEIRTLTLMAFSWFDAAVRNYLLETQPSLTECFDRVVGLCVRSIAETTLSSPQRADPHSTSVMA
jgi:AcrR family transcriptional regulator